MKMERMIGILSILLQQERVTDPQLREKLAQLGCQMRRKYERRK